MVLREVGSEFNTDILVNGTLQNSYTQNSNSSYDVSVSAEFSGTPGGSWSSGNQQSGDSASKTVVAFPSNEFTFNVSWSTNADSNSDWYIKVNGNNVKSGSGDSNGSGSWNGRKLTFKVNSYAYGAISGTFDYNVDLQSSATSISSSVTK